MKALYETYTAHCHVCETQLQFTWDDVTYNRWQAAHLIECVACRADIEVAGPGSDAEAIKEVRTRFK